MSNQEKDEAAVELLDKALTEMDVLADEEKNIFRVDSDTFRFQKIEFKLIEDHKDAFDIEMMEERFTDFLLKYDYIVGDIAYEKLRLRGFFDDGRKSVPIDMKISNLEDYLVEYCSFGCPYFVFERVEKKKEDPESYFKRNKKTNRSRRGPQPKKKPQETQGNKNRSRKNVQGQNQNKNQNKTQGQGQTQNKPQNQGQNKPQNQNKTQSQNQNKTQGQKKTQNQKKNKPQNQNQNKNQKDKRQTKPNDFKFKKKEVEKVNKPQVNKAAPNQQAGKPEDKKQFQIRKKKD